MYPHNTPALDLVHLEGGLHLLAPKMKFNSILITFTSLFLTSNTDRKISRISLIWVLFLFGTLGWAYFRDYCCKVDIATIIHWDY